MTTFIEDTTKRTIEEVYDLKEGIFISAKEFFNRPEAEIMSFRKYLEEAIQLNQPRFVCSHCQQMVKISGKPTVKGKVSFFSHLYDSDDCDIKTTTQLSKEEIDARRYGLEGESLRHKTLKNFIGRYLERTDEVTDVQISKRITSDIPFLNWRCPDVSAQYRGKKLVFELQLSTTFLSVIVDRDIFYRLNNYYVIWVFNINNDNDKLTLENLLAKDIYYANKRNVFLLDQEAMDKSEIEGVLYLNVTWLDENNKFVEKRLISLEELSFDDNNYKPYYYDADSAYFDKHPEAQQRIASLERTRQQIIDALMMKKKAEEERKQKIAAAQARKREEMRQTGGIATPYMQGKRWGYEYNDTKLTLPIYASASEIGSDGYGYVVKNRRIGLVDQCGEEVLSCQFKSIHILFTGCFLVEDNGYWSIYHGETIDKVKKGDTITKSTLNENFASVTINRETENIVVIVRKDGAIKRVDSVSAFEGGTASIITKGHWRSGHSWQDGYGYWRYERKSYAPGESKLLTFNGFIIKATTNSEVFPAEDFTGKVGILNRDFSPVSKFTYSSVSLIDAENARVKDFGEYGLISLNKEAGLFEEKIPCAYYDLEYYPLCGLAKVRNSSGWGVIDANGKVIIPTKYDAIGEIEEGKINVRKGSRMGACDYSGKEIIEEKRPFTANLEIGKFFDKYGIINTENQSIIAFEYNSISLINDQLILADQSLFNLNGDLLCSNILNVQILNSNLISCQKYRHILLFDSKGCQLLEDYGIRSISDFNDGNATVELIDGAKGLISEKGEIVADSEEQLSQDLIKQKIMGYWGIRRPSGELLFPTIYNEIKPLYNNNIVLSNDKQILIIDSQGSLIKEVLNTSFVSTINNSLFKAKSTGGYGIYNNDGEVILPCEYLEIGTETNGYIVIERQTSKEKKFGRWITHETYYYYGLLDSSGKKVLPVKNRNIIIHDDVIEVVNHGTHVIYDLQINKLCEYHRVKDLGLGYKKIQPPQERANRGQEAKCGVVNSKWELIIPCNYYTIKLFSNEWFALNRDGKWGYVSVDLTQSSPCIYPNLCLNENNVPSVKMGKTIIPCSEYVERKRLEVNHSYKAVVEEMREYGLMVKIEEYRCLLHISEIRKLDKEISDYKIGDEIEVVVASFDKNKKRYLLSAK